MHLQELQNRHEENLRIKQNLTSCQHILKHITYIQNIFKSYSIKIPVKKVQLGTVTYVQIIIFPINYKTKVRLSEMTHLEALPVHDSGT